MPRRRRRRCKAFSQRALGLGTKVEQREHRLSKKTARKIARDHLCLNARYYAKES